MTEIRIRNGVLRTLPAQWTVYAWDTTRNDDNFIYTNAIGATYSIWDEWALNNTYVHISTWGGADPVAVYATLYPQKTVLGSLVNPNTATYPPNTPIGNTTTYPSYFTTTWYYVGANIELSTNTIWGSVFQLNIPSPTFDLRQLIISLGVRNSGNEPIWSAVSINYFLDFSNNHDYFECRVGEIIHKVKLNQFNRNNPHMCAIRRGTTQIHFYVDSMLIASINFPSGTLWTAQNSTIDYNTWWYLSPYGYAPVSGTFNNTYPLIYALFRLDMSIVYDHSQMLLLCKSRYAVDDSAHSASTQTITLNGSNFAVFDSSVFNTVFL